MKFSKYQNLHKTVKSAAPATRLQNFRPIDQERRSHVPHPCAAFHLNRKPQAPISQPCPRHDPFIPALINDCLAWPVAGIKNLLVGEVAQ